MRSLMFVLACVAVLFLLVPAPAMATGGLAVVQNGCGQAVVQQVVAQPQFVVHRQVQFVRQPAFQRQVQFVQQPAFIPQRSFSFNRVGGFGGSSALQFSRVGGFGSSALQFNSFNPGFRTGFSTGFNTGFSTFGGFPRSSAFSFQSGFGSPFGTSFIRTRSFGF